MKIEVKTSPIGDAQAFKAALIPYLDRAGQETAVVMKRRITNNRSAWESRLLNSINMDVTGELGRFVGSHTDHARMVEEGTGPAAGLPRYFPNFDNLVPWIKAHPKGPREALKKDGTKARFFQEAEFVNRAFQLARFIYWHGTTKAPFAEPTSYEMAPRIHELLAQGTAAGVKAQLGAQ